MARFVVLLSFTEQGVSDIKASTSRAEAFHQRVDQAGGAVESLTWTLGGIDGVLVFTAPDEATAVALVLGLRRQMTVKTTMLRAFDAAEFEKITNKLD